MFHALLNMNYIYNYVNMNNTDTSKTEKYCLGKYKPRAENLNVILYREKRYTELVKYWHWALNRGMAWILTLKLALNDNAIWQLEASFSPKFIHGYEIAWIVKW